jgi:hypothetical protein
VSARKIVIALALGGSAQVYAQRLEVKSEHPRLFASAAQWATLSTASDPTSVKLRSAILNRADKVCGRPPVKYIKVGRRLLGAMRQGQERILALAAAFRLQATQKYLDQAVLEMRTLASLPDWNPSHFLDVAEGTFGLGVGYDWLYPQLSLDDRQLIAAAIHDKGLLEGKSDKLWWVRGKNNWNQVCHGGLVVGALAIAERDPELTAFLVQRAAQCVPICNFSYAPDGGYAEGPAYWGYGTSFQVLLIDALKTATGQTLQLESSPGFMDSAEYITQTTTPTGRFYSYSDSGDGREMLAALLWFYRAAHRSDSAREEVNRYLAKADRFLPLALVWWSPTNAKTTQEPLHRRFRGEVPIAVHRSAWNDPKASYIAAKGGTASASHAHMDVGSFIVEADGVRWALDLGSQDYNSLEQAGVDLWNSKDGSQRWDVFRIGPDSHNILRIGNHPQPVKGRGEILSHTDSGPLPHTVFDISGVYAPYATSVMRGIAITSDAQIVIQDEWRGATEPVTFQWLTRASVEVNGLEVTLNDKGQSLKLLSHGASSVSVEDASAPVHSYDIANPGLKRIVYKLQGSLFRLVGVPGSLAQPIPLPIQRLADWGR